VILFFEQIFFILLTKLMSVERGFSINRYLVFLKIDKGIFFTSFVGTDIIIKSDLIF